MKLTAWLKSGLVSLFFLLGLTPEASAHNAVSYFSEEAIAVAGLLIVMLSVCLICAIVGLFRTNKFIRVCSITGAVVSTLILLFITTFNGFDFFIPVALIITALLWLAIYFRKTTKPKKHSSSPIKVAFLESSVFLVVSMLLIWSIHIIIPNLESRSTVLFTLYVLAAIAIVYFGHRHYFTRLLKQGITPTFSDGMKVSLYSIIIYSLFFITHTIFMGFTQFYDFMPLLQVLKVLLIGALPVLGIGALISYLITPKSTPNSTALNE